MKAAVRTRLGLPPAWIAAQVLGRSLTVRDGSVRAKPDYDDAWCLACALHARIVFDVGSNVGQAALPMLVSGGPELVVLIDANPRALAYAAENIFRNGLWHRARFVCAFAAERGGTPSAFGQWEQDPLEATALNTLSQRPSAPAVLRFQRSLLMICVGGSVATRTL